MEIELTWWHAIYAGITVLVLVGGIVGGMFLALRDPKGWKRIKLPKPKPWLPNEEQEKEIKNPKFEQKDILKETYTGKSWKCGTSTDGFIVKEVFIGLAGESGYWYKIYSRQWGKDWNDRFIGQGKTLDEARSRGLGFLRDRKNMDEELLEKYGVTLYNNILKV